MRKLSISALLALVVAGALPALGWAPAMASPGDQYAGPYFGENNFPPGCTRDMSPANPDNTCYRMKTDLNALDSPQVDVLVMVPVSPTAERDMRIMRQSVEMWEGGIDYLAGEMGLDWVKQGVDFHITVDYVDPAGGAGSEFTTYPIVDPEIVVIATNPVGGAGIGIDPVDFSAEVFAFTDEDGVPCHNVANPFDFEYWENLPGFDNHHEERTGTYTEDCGGAGGNICFAINGAIDPEPTTIDIFNLFDLVSHEFGHCLTLGHVGDGGETITGDGWGVVPTNDIMSYNTDPPGLNKCVSTLDVEGLAVRMSRYLDVNGDGAVDGGDTLLANDQIGAGGFPFQVQHPHDHLYASKTGAPMDCPQPDLGLVPGERTDWTPEPVATSQAVLDIASPADGATISDGALDVSGTVQHEALFEGPPPPTSSTGSYLDDPDDATSPITEILQLDVAVTATHVEATMTLADLWPSTTAASPVSYTVSIDGKAFDSFIRYPIDANPMTWDGSAYMAPGTSTWDLEAKTVSFHIPRDYLDRAGVVAPYFVASTANFGTLLAIAPDDFAPEDGETVGVASARVVDVPGTSVASTTVDFQHEDGNTFFPEESTLGVRDLVDDTSHTFGLDITQTSDVEFNLNWTDTVGGTDLDLYVRGAASSDNEGATAGKPETFMLPSVNGHLDIRVTPFLVTEPLGTDYTLTATITPLGGGGGGPEPDADRDGVADPADSCPMHPGTGADGCTVLTATQVEVFVDGAPAGSQDVYADYGPDSFDIPVTISEGTHELRVDWVDGGDVLARRTLSITRPGGGSGGPDGDGDGVADADDNCPDVANADQANLDGDAKGDVCDPDMDGDGHSNAKESALGSNPADPDSVPPKKRGQP